MYKRRNEYRDDRGKFFHKAQDVKKEEDFFFSKKAKD